MSSLPTFTDDLLLWINLPFLRKQSQIPFFPSTPDQDPVSIARKALYEAKSTGYNILIIDTAGRLHLDEELMEELRRMKKRCIRERFSLLPIP